MPTTFERLAAYGVQPPTILVPKKEIDLQKWAVVACDQYTSEPEYWKRVEAYVGDAPSALKLIYPELYLEEKNPRKRIAALNRSRNRYLEDDLFDVYEKSFFLIHREDEGGATVDGAFSQRWIWNTTIGTTARAPSSGQVKKRFSIGFLPARRFAMMPHWRYPISSS